MAERFRGPAACVPSNVSTTPCRANIKIAAIVQLAESNETADCDCRSGYSGDAALTTWPGIGRAPCAVGGGGIFASAGT